MSVFNKEELMEDALRYYARGDRDIRYAINHLMDKGYSDEALEYAEKELNKIHRGQRQSLPARILASLLFGLVVGIIVSYLAEDGVWSGSTWIFGGIAALLFAVLHRKVGALFTNQRIK